MVRTSNIIKVDFLGSSKSVSVAGSGEKSGEVSGVFCSFWLLLFLGSIF